MVLTALAAAGARKPTKDVCDGGPRARSENFTSTRSGESDDEKGVKEELELDMYCAGEIGRSILFSKQLRVSWFVIENVFTHRVTSPGHVFSYIGLLLFPWAH